MEPFNPQTVTLVDANSNSNLIEASAGTGKTYSIALLLLRVIMELDMPINRILVVTFTNAAVAELQERVRKFLFLANEAIAGEDIDQPHITAIVAQASANVGHDKVQQNLRTSLLLMDESNISTIHGFCQMVLNKYAFETQQIFGAQLLTNADDFIEDEINKFWRSQITTLPLAILNELDTPKLRSEFSLIVKNDLAGKILELGNREDLIRLSFDEAANSLSHLQNDVKLKEKELESLFNSEEIKRVNNSLGKSTHLFKASDNFELWLPAFENAYNKKQAMINKFPDSLLALYEERCASLDNYAQQVSQITFSLYALCLAIVPQKIKDRLKRSNALTFNDLILNLYDVLQDNPETLINKVRKDFSAVFIDEFQDTDQAQFKIFKKLFFENSDTLSFMIGDPKQSIYAFRGADVDAYLSAKSLVNRQFTMNKNFRSSQQMVEAANTFFLPEENFDTFYYDDPEQGIRYHSVDHTSNIGHVLNNNEKTAAIEFFPYPNEGAFLQNAANLISQLISGEHYIKEKDGSIRRIVPADIGVLVRSNKRGKKVKLLLEELGVPSVQISDEKILNDPIIYDIIVILEAVINPQNAAIHRALFTNLLGYNASQIITLDNEKSMELFRAYQTVWNAGSVYELLMRISKDFALEDRLLANLTTQRTLANFHQLSQLLHQKQVRRGFSPEELISWIKKNIGENSEEITEFEQQMESDEDAVKIVTIHKSKGLQYNIVFCIGFNFNNKIDTKKTFFDFKDETHQQCYTPIALANEKIFELCSRLNEQENRRIMYVAITRAVYKCFIFYSTHQFNNSSLSTFMEFIQENGPLQIMGSAEIAGQPYTAIEATKPSIINWSPQDVFIPDEHWRKLSFTALSAHGERLMLDIEPQTDASDYDNFVYRDLGFGAQLGTMLHNLFERIDFNNPSTWPKQTNKIFNHLLPDNEQKSHPLLQLLDHVLGAKINTGLDSFSLSEVATSKTIKELQFDFLIKPTQVDDLLQILQEHRSFRFSLASNESLDGFLNGFIDLFFEHNSKFYILDWKSNFLGNTASNYDSDVLESAMVQNNYHLQYLIYCMAAYQFLRARLGQDFNYDTQFGGVIYLFVRGMRKEAQSGIYFVKPEKTIIENALSLLTKSKFTT